jgi:cyclopropane-fatty-acyl-phospholipid synthase
MLYKFKSKAASDLIMLEPNGRRVLEIVGKVPGPSGIIEPTQLDTAVKALEQAIQAEEAARKAAVEQAEARGEDPPVFEGVSLRQRATPFIEMLRRSEKADVPVVWGV